MKIKLAATLMFLMLLSTSIPLLMPIEQARAQPPPELRVVPDYVLGGDIGSEFSVDVTMNDLDIGWNCTAVEFKLLYDSTLLEVTNVVEGPFMATFNSTYFVNFVEDWPPHGPHVLVGVTLAGWPQYASGTGTLVTITFKVLYRPVVPEEANCSLALEDTQVLYVEEEIPHTTVDGFYRSWPTGNSMWVDPKLPDIIVGGPIGSEFSIDVTMEIVSVEDRVTAVQFRIPYCEGLLEVVSMVEGTLFASAGPTYFIPIDEYHPDWGWNVLIGILLLPNATGHWNTFPSGTGTLATITFRVLSRPVAPDTACCDLMLRDTQVLNDDQEEIDHIVYHGKYCASPILPPTLSVDPNPVVGGVIGSEFSVDVNMNDLDVDWNATAVQFRLLYCAGLLEFVSAVEGPFMATFGTTYFMSFDENWPPYGPHVLAGIILLPPYTTFPSGTGTLTTITFRVLDRPVAPDIMWCLLELEDTLLVDKDIEEIPHYAVDSLYKALQIFPPTLKVEPALVEMTAAYQEFDVNITMNDLDPDWNLTMVQFRLLYNRTLLEVTNVVEGPFMPGNTFFINFVEDWPPWGPNVLVGVLLLEYPPYPGGTGTLATITFNVTYQARDPVPSLGCDLALAETLLLDEDVVEIPHYTEDGYYIIYSTNIGDVNLDGKVDMRDIGAIASAFGTSEEYPGEPPRWNPLYDVNRDGKIDMKDIAIAARNFGWPYA